MPADFVSKGIVIVMTRELSEEQLVRRIKLHTLLALLGAVIAVASLAGQYVIFVALGVTLPENLAQVASQRSCWRLSSCFLS